MSTEGPEVYKEWILTIIDQLRRRKARPDLERICHFVERRYGLKRDVTETHLEKLVDQGVVVKVVYKRGTSYRTVAKLRSKGYGTNVLNSKSASRRILEAVEGVLRERSESRTSEERQNEDSSNEEQSPNGSKEGVSAREIENWLSSNSKSGKGGGDNDNGGDDQDENETEPFRYPIRVVIQREVDVGHLTRLDNGNYLPLPASEADKQRTSPTRPQLQKSMSIFAKRGRPPKRKMVSLPNWFPKPLSKACGMEVARLSFLGPMYAWSVFAEDNLPIGRSLSCGDVQASPARPESQVAPVPIMPPHVCDFCQQPADLNKDGHEEELLFCKDCNAKAHPSCMQYSPELAKRARNTAWQCIDCKTCCICYDPGEADCMLFCDACDKGYHMLCHDPQVTDKPQGKWVCQECVLDGVDIDEIDDNSYTNLVDSTVRSTDSESVSSLRSRSYWNSEKDLRHYHHQGSLSPPPRKVFKENQTPEEKYPYVGNWSTAEITDFFKQKGFGEQAEAFEQQEIDGQSLLLLKRSDVLTGLTLKLGPALKIYNIVMKLQSQTV